MEGTSIPPAINWLRDNLDRAERIERGRLIEELIAHPGWEALCEVATATANRGEARLRSIAEKAALSADPQQAIDYAAKRGAQSNVNFHPDVAKSILDSAKTAVDELKREAEAEKATAGGRS